MTARHILIRTGLLAVLTAAAIGRAELGADTEASVIFAPAFGAALPVALLAAWGAAGQFGQGGVAGWLRAAAASLMVLVVAGLLAPLGSPLLGGVQRGVTELLLALPLHPLSWGAALAAAVTVQLVALRQNRAADQSRK